MKKQGVKHKRKVKYEKPEIKHYTVEELSKTWNFEVFGLCAPCAAVAYCCFPET